MKEIAMIGGIFETEEGAKAFKICSKMTQSW